MKAFHSTPCFTAALLVGLLPALVLAGPDDAPDSRRSETRITTRPAPPGVTVQRTTSTVTTREDDADDRPIQPLRQREESVHYRIAYKLLNNVGLTGAEGDRQPVGYQQIYGPPPMLIYHRPPAPRPRRFPHFAASEDKPAAGKPGPDEEKPDSAPDASPAATGSPSPATPQPAAKPSPDDGDPGILPDPAQQGAQGRNHEILSYFQRPNSTSRPQAGYAGPGNGATQGEAGGDPGYLQAPDQPQPIPPSRATYRVVPQ